MTDPLTDTRRLDAIIEEALTDGRFSPAERRAVMSRLLPREGRGALLRYGVMLMLSVTIAAVGLAANSAAVVIGAMLVAPLMTPIMTFATACALGLPQRMARAGIVVVVSTLGSILLSVFLAWVLPDFELQSEVTSRTAPDVKDFVVAVAAGAAGAYATAREELSTSLPGVAVAVALVPPLAAVGITLQAGETDLASGALLLYLTNLVAIVVVSMGVLFATGVVPTIKLVTRHPAVSAVVALVVVAFFAIFVPLAARSASAVEDAQRRSEVRSATEAWLGDAELIIDDITIDGANVTVDLIGPDSPPRAFDLRTSLEPLLGSDTDVAVRWSEQSLGLALAGQSAEDSLSTSERVDPVVTSWLSAEYGEGYELLGIDAAGGEVVLEIAGPTAPQATAALAEQVGLAVGGEVNLSVQWVQRLGVGGSADPEVIAAELVEAWIGPRHSVTLVAAAATPRSVTVDLAATSEPLGVSRLIEALETRLLGRQATIRVARLDEAPATGTVAEVAPGSLG
ncbi:MAG: DUF389 domain-containing protein [Acidimicrobiales bacterium]|nr:DUF389 domain-containing protein [Acidimicrobiales bacterium]